MAQGGTALFTAILSAIQGVAAVTGHKVVVIFTDGADRNSLVGTRKLRRAVEETDAVIYFVTAGDAAKDREIRDFLRDLSELSGGRTLDGEDRNDLRKAFQQISEETRNQYLLTYVPPRIARPGTWMPLSVKARCDDCRVRARKGYRVADR